MRAHQRVSRHHRHPGRGLACLRWPFLVGAGARGTGSGLCPVPRSVRPAAGWAFRRRHAIIVA